MIFPINVAFIVFNKNNLNFGSYKEVFLAEKEEEDKYDANMMLSTVSLDNTDPEECSVTGSVRSLNKPTQKKTNWKKRINFTWFCLKSYYTAPVNKFLMNMVSVQFFITSVLLLIPKEHFHSSVVCVIYLYKLC